MNDGLKCTRCDFEIPKKYGRTPILGTIKHLMQLVVVDERANEAVFYCHQCKKLFITETGSYIQVVAD